MLQFFSASTSIVNSKRAITECIENALEGQPNLDCDLIIINTALGHNFKELLSEAHSLSPNAQIVGCSCCGVIGKEGPNESIKALAIMAIKGPKTEFTVSGSDSSILSDPYNSGVQLAWDLKNKNPEINLILLYPSGMLYDYDKIIAGIESVFGPDVPIVGGVSIDGKLITDFQFFDEKVVEKSAVIVGFADPSIELISQATLGSDVIGSPLEVTRSEDNHVFELDGKNAWECLMDKLGMPLSTSVWDVMTVAALATEIPGKSYEEYDSRYRIVGGLIPEADGSLFTSGPSPAGTKLWLARGNEKKVFDGADQMMTRILKRLEGRNPVAVFHSDCSGRGKALFNRIMKDELINRLQYPICKGENIPWLGIYGGGEFTPLGGKNQMLLYTSSLYVLAKRKE
ncbi:MAG: FIST C-terminal domain-containing protein [Bacteroidia bacterium]|nr:FIST C-terminal domain-containing protein [Bacteroidia bacterium]